MEQTHITKQINRLHASLEDLVQAFNYTKVALTRNPVSSVDSDEKTINHALNTSLIVSYWRPFSGNKGSDDMQDNLPKKIIKNFSDEEKAMHIRIGNARNTIYAHTDDSACQVRALPTRQDNVFQALRIVTFKQFSIEELSLIKSMIEKLVSNVYEKLKQLQS